MLFLRKHCNLKTRLWFFVSLVLLSAACKREATTWDSDLLFPVAKGRISLTDLIPDSLLQIGDDDVTHLVYEDDIFNLEIDSLFTIPDTSIRESFLFPVPGGPFIIEPGFEVVSLQETFNFDMDEVQLREVDVKAGVINYVAKNYIDGELLLQYEIPGVTKDGESFVIEATIGPGSSTNPTIIEGVLDLSGYHMDLMGEDGVAFNQMVSVTNVSVHPDAAEPATVFGNDSVSITLDFISPSISYARGFFGQELTTFDDTSAFDAISSLISGGLALNDISLGLTLRNFVGVDAQARFDQLKAINTVDGTAVYLEHPEIGEELNITRAFDNNGNVEPTEYAFQLNGDNSNIETFIEILPNALEISGEFEVNPLGNVSGSNDFIYSAKPIEAILNLDVPLCVGLDQLTLRDTLSIDFDEELNVSGKIHIYATNGFPFSADISVEVVDMQANSLASLVAESDLDPAYIEDDELVEVESTLALEFVQGDVDQINSSNQLVITVVFDTQGNEAKIEASHYLDVKIVADVRGEIGYE